MQPFLHKSAVKKVARDIKIEVMCCAHLVVGLAQDAVQEWAVGLYRGRVEVLVFRHAAVGTHDSISTAQNPCRNRNDAPQTTRDAFLNGNEITFQVSVSGGRCETTTKATTKDDDAHSVSFVVTVERAVVVFTVHVHKQHELVER